MQIDPKFCEALDRMLIISIAVVWAVLLYTYKRGTTVEVQRCADGKIISLLDALSNLTYTSSQLL